MIFEDTTNLFSWDIEWVNLSDPAIAAHFHGPASTTENIGIQVNFGAISGLTSPSIGGVLITDAQAAELLAGRWYINIHTPQFPAGEIREQVVRSNARVPITAPLLLILFALSGIFLGRHRSTSV